ncbi:MAG: hypothetical protein D6772_06320, partial [Bacteroidetes bacterium]
MIESLYRLGKALQTRPDEYGDYFQPWQNPFPKRRAELSYKVLVFDIEADKLTGYELQDFRSGWLDKYLYRELKGARGAPLVPTTFFYPNSNEEKHEEGVDKLLSRLQRAIPDGKSLYFSSTASKEAALGKVKDILLTQSFPTKDHKYLLTFRLDGKWLGEYEELRSLYEAEAYAKYYEKSKAKDKTCAVSYATDTEVWGRVDTLGFTVNDLAFNRGGFEGAKSYRMFPVSKEAALTLEGARRFALAKLTESFFNLRYMIVPHLVEGDERILESVIRELSQERTNTKLQEQLQPIFSSGDRLSRIATRKELAPVGMLYDILFFQKKQAQLALLLHLQDVNPSHLAKLYQVILSVSRFYGPVAWLMSKGERIPFYVSFNRIKDYFAEQKQNGTEWIFEPYFFQLLESVFYGQALDVARINKALIQKIQLLFRQHHDSPIHFALQAKQAFAIWQFFNQMGLFPGKITIDMSDDQVLQLEATAFVRQHAAFFSNPVLEAAFYLGVLTNI